MKGICPIIAIIIILLITIAIAGAAYSYISIVWGGMTTRAIEITGQTCTGGLTTVYVKNAGTNVLTNTDFLIERDIAGTSTTLTSGTEYAAIADIAQGDTGTIVELATQGCGATNYCKYTIIVGGRVSRSDVKC